MRALKPPARLVLTAGALLVAAAVCPAGAAADPPLGYVTLVKTPKLGQYIGETRQEREATLDVGRRSLKKAVFEVDCGLGAGRLSLRRVKVRETARGFEFKSRRKRPVRYDDGHAPDTASVVISGRFARTGRKATGRVRVDSPYCGKSEVRWSATYTATPVKAPESGAYSGPTKQGRDLGLSVSGDSIELAAIEFKCGNTDGHTVLNDIPMRRTRQGFAFDIRAHGGVGYEDGYPEENAAVDITGLFAPSGTKASGRLRVNSPRCGGTGWIGWTAKRQQDG